MDYEQRRKRALWRAGHRGTRELDLLMSQFVRDFLSEYRVSGPCEDREISLSRLERLHAGTSAAVS